MIQTPASPSQVVRKAAGHFFIAFGRAAFGTIALRVPNPEEGNVITVHLSESRSDFITVNRTPAATDHYRQLSLHLKAGQTDYRLVIPAFVPFYSGQIPMPAYVGEEMPFRYVELVTVPDSFQADDIQQVATDVPFNDDAASFTSSDRVFNDV